MADPVLNDLTQKYQELVGKTFEGEYKGVFNMPQTGNQRDVLSVGQGDPLAKILGGISNAVLLAYGKTVWKGITGPEDSSRYTNHWLWVEPDFSGQLQEGLSYDFKIVRCMPFTCGGGDFKHGVSIKVDKFIETAAKSEVGVDNLAEQKSSAVSAVKYQSSR